MTIQKTPSQVQAAGRVVYEARSLITGEPIRVTGKSPEEMRKEYDLLTALLQGHSAKRAGPGDPGAPSV